MAQITKKTISNSKFKNQIQKSTANYEITL